MAQVPLKNRDKVVRTLHELNSKAGAQLQSSMLPGRSVPKPPKVGEIMAQYLQKAMILHAVGVQVAPSLAWK